MPSMLELETALLQSPLVTAFYRQVVPRWMGLPAGRYRVKVVENLQVPTPDGLLLATDVYMPVGVAQGPAVLMRTPYSKGGAGSMIAGLFAWQFATHGYHVVCQDCRGRFGSTDDNNPKFTAFLHEAEDGKATLDWIAAQPWSDGSVAMWGASYLGYCQWAAASTGSPHLKAIAPLITSSKLMNYPQHGFPLDLLLRWMFQMGAMDDNTLGMRERLRRINDGPYQDTFLAEAFAWLPMRTADEAAIGQPDDLYREMADADATHPYWQQADHSGAVATAPPANFTSGWYDLFLDGLLADYMAQRDAGKQPYLTIGPWSHLDIGYLPVAFSEGLAWFDAHLKGKQAGLRKRPVRLFIMGADRWRTFDGWPPPATAHPLYLHGNGVAKTGRLRWELPPAGAAPDHYTYDPALPTPNLGGPKMGTDAGPVDNRPLEGRPDVLVFSSVPLPGALTVAGYVRARLYVRSNRATADFFVRLCDVHPDGKSINVCDGNFRIQPGRGEAQPDGSLRITVEMSATAYQFAAGHRLRVQVSSGAHPRFARNLGVPEPQTAATDCVTAEQTVYHDADHPSAVVLPVLSE